MTKDACACTETSPRLPRTGSASSLKGGVSLKEKRYQRVVLEATCANPNTTASARGEGGHGPKEPPSASGHSWAEHGTEQAAKSKTKTVIKLKKKDLLYVYYPFHSPAFPFRRCKEHEHHSRLGPGCMPRLCHVHPMMRMLHKPLLTEALQTSNHPRKATPQTVKAEKEVKAEQIALYSKMCGAVQYKMNTKQIHKMFRLAAHHGGLKKKKKKPLNFQSQFCGVCILCIFPCCKWHFLMR